MPNFQIAIATRDAKGEVVPSIVGKTQALGIKPSTAGIASRRIDDRRISRAVRRGMDAANVIDTLITARDSDDSASVEIANRLLANKEFLRAMLSSLEKVRDEVKASMPAAGAGEPETEKHGGPDYPESPSPNHRPTSGSGLPGTDSRQTGPYTKQHLIRDLATQNGAVARLALKVGMDAAISQVNASPLVPPWTSPVWTNEARQYLNVRASYDGWARQHIDTVGDLYKLHPEEYDQPMPHPRSFDR